jgi:serine/threonine protein kinase
VLLGDDGVFVIDLEYCELLDAEGRTGRKGTWCTVAPEAARDDGYCSIKSDVYSLGATAFYLLSGVYPVDHTLGAAEQQRRIVAGNIRELRQAAPHISQAVGTVVRKALNLDPAARFDSALAFGNALTQAARGARDWRRVAHGGHSHCFEGSPAHNRAGVVICAIPNAADYQVRARLISSDRRVAGMPDTVVKTGQLARTLQQRVRKLS